MSTCPTCPLRSDNQLGYLSVTCSDSLLPILTSCNWQLVRSSFVTTTTLERCISESACDSDGVTTPQCVTKSDKCVTTVCHKKWLSDSILRWVFINTDMCHREWQCIMTRDSVTSGYVGWWQCDNTDSGSQGVTSNLSHFRVTAQPATHVPAEGFCPAAAAISSSTSLRRDHFGLSSSKRSSKRRTWEGLYTYGSGHRHPHHTHTPHTHHIYHTPHIPHTTTHIHTHTHHTHTPHTPHTHTHTCTHTLVTRPH